MAPVTRFPDGFLWGAATAGHQVEGGNVNADLWPMEWTENSVSSSRRVTHATTTTATPRTWPLLAELGLTAYRFSLEWSRIEPEPGYFSRAALDHYRRMLECCLNLGVMPVVTLNHFTLPRWMAGEGGWLAGRTRQSTSPATPLMWRNIWAACSRGWARSTSPT